MHANLRINALIPEPVNTSQRTKTHPGEAKHGLSKPQDLMSTYLYLMGPASKGVSGETVFCQSYELYGCGNKEKKV